MFIACVEIFDQRRSEERNPTRPSARKPFPLLRTPPEGSSASSYKHATPNGVKPVTIFHSFFREVVLTSWDRRLCVSQCALLLAIGSEPHCRDLIFMFTSRRITK